MNQPLLLAKRPVVLFVGSWLAGAVALTSVSAMATDAPPSDAEFSVPPAPVSTLETPAFTPEVASLLSPFFWREGVPQGEAERLAPFRDRLIEALDRQPSLRAQWAREAESTLRVDEVRAERLPQVNMGLEQRNSLNGVNRNAFDSGNRLDAVASVSQLLYDFGASGQRLEAAHLEAEAQRWQSQALGQQVVMDAITAHYDVLRFSSQLALAEDNLIQHQRILDDVAARSEGGAGSRADVLRAESRLAEARAQLVNLQGQLARARNAYFEAYFTYPTELGMPSLPVSSTGNVETALEMAQRVDAELNRSLRENEAFQAKALAERSSQFPRLSVNLEGRQFDIDQPSESESDLALLFQVDYSPYTGGAATSRTAQAERRFEQAVFERQALQRELETRLRSAFTDLKSRRESLRAQSLTLTADQQALEAYRAQFSIGRRSLGDLLDAQRDLFQSARGLVDSRIEWELARFQQLAVTSQLLPTLEIVIESQGRL